MSGVGPTVSCMGLTVEMVTFDTTDAVALATWWARQLGGEVRDEADGWFVVAADVTGVARVGFQKVDQVTPGKNRVHLDLSATDAKAEIDRLVADGATYVDSHTEGGFSWTVLADPDGNQFCVSQH